MNYLDIQLEDEAIRQQFISFIEKGQYQEALGLLSEKYQPKAMTAKSLNSLTDKIVEVENLNDPSFKNDKIKVSETPPENLPVGGVYFELI